NRITDPRLDGAQRQRLLDALDSGKAGNLRAVDAFVVGGVGGNDAQEIVELTAHQVAFQNLRNPLHRLLEMFERFSRLSAERHFDEEFVAQSEGGAID